MTVEGLLLALVGLLLLDALLLAVALLAVLRLLWLRRAEARVVLVEGSSRRPLVRR